MKYRDTTELTVVEDLQAFAELLKEPYMTEIRAEIAGWLNKKLNTLHNADFFGTEGQCDPRGDHRG